MDWAALDELRERSRRLNLRVKEHLRARHRGEPFDRQEWDELLRERDEIERDQQRWFDQRFDP